MSRDSLAGYMVCCCVTIIVGIVLFFMSPLMGIFVFIIMFLGIAIIYVYRMQEDGEPSPPSFLSSPAPTNELSSTEIGELEETDTLQAVSVEVQVEKTITEAEVAKKPTTIISSAKLQEQIDELEKRVQLLKGQLAEDEFDDSGVSPPLSESLSLDMEPSLDDDRELSELAVRQLLEALDEKLAKRAISKQLYKRLRNKYLARLEKQERGRDTSSARGKKEYTTGDK